MTLNLLEASFGESHPKRLTNRVITSFTLVGSSRDFTL
jgi:hypothetical protein